uniref:Reverse transcriptase domain-containing protein n=1 Tax=Tanacetum cinerariifolium TaxID=118510 RepID=A0A6L2LWH1_TANCI|nr:hypothetical protein [Tanacetum cinerariifolium]
MAPVTRQGQNPPPTNTDTPPHHMTPKSVQAMIDQALLRNSTNEDGSQSSYEDNPRHVQTTRPCFYADFMKCHRLNFKGNEGVVGLTRWIEKMESVFNISGCAIENQVKFATCTLLDAALTWWNSQIRTLGPEAYAMTWETNDLMDQKLHTYAERADHKRKTDDMSRNNHGHQQQPFKKQNVAKVYNMGTGERKPYEGSLPKSFATLMLQMLRGTVRKLPKEMYKFWGVTSTTEAEYVAAASCCGQFWETASSSTSENGEIVITASIDRRVKSVTEASIGRHLKLEDSEVTPSDIQYSAATQIWGCYTLLQSDPTISPPLISSPSRVPTPLHDSPLLGGNTPGTDQTDIWCRYTKIIMKGRKITQIDEDEGITLVQMVTTVGAEISTASPEDKTAKTSNDSDDITLAETLIEVKRSATKPQKVKGVAFRDVEETPRLVRSTITLQPLPSIDPKEKGKGVLVEEEPVKVKRRDQGLAQIKSDAELAKRLYKEELAEVDRAQKERQKQKEATIVVLNEEFDEIQARMDADHELAARLTYEEQEW